jgi:hypothetical protein
MLKLALNTNFPFRGGQGRGRMKIIKHVSLTKKEVEDAVAVYLRDKGFEVRYMSNEPLIVWSNETSIPFCTVEVTPEKD